MSLRDGEVVEADTQGGGVGLVESERGWPGEVTTEQDHNTRDSNRIRNSFSLTHSLIHSSTLSLSLLFALVVVDYK